MTSTRERMEAYVAQRNKKNKKNKVSMGKVITPRDEMSQAEVSTVLPTGLAVLDHHILGIGGWPNRRIIELYGPPGGGKSTLLLRAIANALNLGGEALLIDSENSFDRHWGHLHLVDDSDPRLAIGNPETAEQAFEQAVTFLSSLPNNGKIHIVGWDSLAAATPSAEFAGNIGDHHVGVRARIANEGFRKCTELCAQKGALMIVINQVRSKIGVMFGSPEETPGGNALKHHASFRMRMGAPEKVERAVAVEEDDASGKKKKTTKKKASEAVDQASEKKKGMKEVWAQNVPVSVKKSRFGPPNRDADLRLVYEEGWDDAWTTINFAKARKVLPPNAPVTEKNVVKALKGLGWLQDEQPDQEEQGDEA